MHATRNVLSEVVSRQYIHSITDTTPALPIPPTPTPISYLLSVIPRPPTSPSPSKLSFSLPRLLCYSSLPPHSSSNISYGIYISFRRVSPPIVSVRRALFDGAVPPLLRRCDRTVDGCFCSSHRAYMFAVDALYLLPCGPHLWVCLLSLNRGCFCGSYTVLCERIETQFVIGLGDSVPGQTGLGSCVTGRWAHTIRPRSVSVSGSLAGVGDWWRRRPSHGSEILLRDG